MSQYDYGRKAFPWDLLAVCMGGCEFLKGKALRFSHAARPLGPQCTCTRKNSAPSRLSKVQEKDSYVDVSYVNSRQLSTLKILKKITVETVDICSSHMY